MSELASESSAPRVRESSTEPRRGSATSGAVVDVITELERRRFAAMVAGDFDEFAAVCHPELLYTHSTGVTDTLESYLATCRAGYYVYHLIDHPVAKIVVSGTTALVLGEMHADLTVGGKRKQLHNSSLAVWVDHDGAWRLIAYQPTPLP